uniref:Uncharacterized protein n=1 Tax=Timema bartmani TaxID=61472 RepID=A0A7R9I787_9NEOP|nr:unnamed protein product [Timema bartmani]
MDEVNAVVSLWLITLEKQEISLPLSHSLLWSSNRMKPRLEDWAIMIDFLEEANIASLSSGSNVKRISYGNLTHVNVSVLVQEDNKAVVYVALDRSDKSYYACDGGCLDDPVQLGLLQSVFNSASPTPPPFRPERKLFPVKLTEPVTAILYITYDRQHMEDLRHAIHVKEIVEAPAHEHHISIVQGMANYDVECIKQDIVLQVDIYTVLQKC